MGCTYEDLKKKSTGVRKDLKHGPMAYGEEIRPGEGEIHELGLAMKKLIVNAAIAKEHPTR